MTDLIDLDVAGSPERRVRFPALARRWDALPVAWRRAIIAALAVRAALAVFAFAFGGLLPGLDPVGVARVPGTSFLGWTASSPAQQGVGLLGAGLERFDALWYLSIAKWGYPPGFGGQAPAAAAFFPGFPILVAILGRLLFGAYLVAANLVALAATAASFAGIHTLVAEETGDDEVARRSLIAAAVFPTAFFLVAPYTESLFLAVTVWAMIWAHRQRWWPAAALAVAAGLTRNVGVLLSIPFALEWWRQRDDTPLGTSVVTAVVAAPFGLSLYMAFSWARFGSPLGPIDAQSGWQRDFTWPWNTLATALRFAVETAGQYATGYHSLDLLVFIPVLVATLWLLRNVPLPYGAYALAHVLVWLVYPFPSRPLMSTPRFALAVAPIFWAFGVWTRSRSGWRGREVAWYATSGALLGVHALLFIDWYYVF